MLALSMILLCGACNILAASETIRTDTDDKCLAHSACEDPNRPCYCDPKCQWFNDCCTNNRNDDTKIDLSSIPKLEYMSCIELSSEGNVQFWVVDQCPGNVEKCFLPDKQDSISNVLPVTDMKNNITFRNSRCAECHGISEFRYWRGSISQASKENCIAAVDYIQNLTTIGNISVEGTADYLLREGCLLSPYPPLGVRPRECVRNMEEVRNCSSQFLPIKHVSAKIAFRNIECCTQYIGNCSTQKYACATRDNINNIWSFPFDRIRSHLDMLSNTFLINFAQGLHHQTLPDEIRYANIEFQKKLILHFSVVVGKEHLESLFCILRTYFENMKDSFLLESFEGEVLQNVNAPTRHSVVIHVNMISHQLFWNTREVVDLQKWLEIMEMTYSTFETLEEKNGNPSLFTMTENFVILPPENTSTIRVAGLSIPSKIQPYLNYLTRKNIACSIINKNRATPKARCQRLEVKVMSANERPTFRFGCSNPSPLQEQTTSRATIGSASAALCMSLVVVLFE